MLMSWQAHVTLQLELLTGMQARAESRQAAMRGAQGANLT